MSKQFAVIICNDPHGFDEILAVTLDRVDIVEKLCNQIFGRKNVSVHRAMTLNRLPENIKDALRADENGEKVDGRFSTLRWMHRKDDGVSSI